MDLNRVVHFDILADEPERLIKFYRDVFGWRFEKWSGPMEYWMIMTGKGPGIDGGMSLRSPESVGTNTIAVKDLDNTLEKVKANGGTVLAAKSVIPGVGWFALFKDANGNIFGLMQEDTEAK